MQICPGCALPTKRASWIVTSPTRYSKPRGRVVGQDQHEGRVEAHIRLEPARAIPDIEPVAGGRARDFDVEPGLAQLLGGRIDRVFEAGELRDLLQRIDLRETDDIEQDDGAMLGARDRVAARDLIDDDRLHLALAVADGEGQIDLDRARLQDFADFGEGLGAHQTPAAQDAVGVGRFGQYAPIGRGAQRHGLPVMRPADDDILAQLPSGVAGEVEFAQAFPDFVVAGHVAAILAELRERGSVRAATACI